MGPKKTPEEYNSLKFQPPIESKKLSLQNHCTKGYREFKIITLTLKITESSSG